MKLITTIYNLLWGDLVTIPLPGGGSLPLTVRVSDIASIGGGGS